EDRVPREPGTLGHVHQERDVAVRERRENELPLEAHEPRYGIGPRVEAVPGAVQVVDLRLGESGDAEPDEELIERHPVEIVELGPRHRAAPHLLQHGLVEAAPRVSERCPADLQALGAPERLTLADQARPPVNDGAEDVEGQRLDRRDVDTTTGPSHRPSPAAAARVRASAPARTRSSTAATSAHSRRTRAAAAAAEILETEEAAS